MMLPFGSTSSKPWTRSSDEMRNATLSPAFSVLLSIFGEIVITPSRSVTSKIFASVVGVDDTPLSADIAMYVGSVVALSTSDAYAKIGWSDVKLTQASLRSEPAGTLKKNVVAMLVGPMTPNAGIDTGVPVAMSA